MNKLLEAIEEYQTQKGLNDSRFSQLIGIDFSTLSKVKSGHRRPGGKVLTALMQIPELRPVVSAYMVGTGTTTPQHPPRPKLRGFGIFQALRHYLGGRILKRG